MELQNKLFLKKTQKNIRSTRIFVFFCHFLLIIVFALIGGMNKRMDIELYPTILFLLFGEATAIIADWAMFNTGGRYDFKVKSILDSTAIVTVTAYDSCGVDIDKWDQILEIDQWEELLKEQELEKNNNDLSYFIGKTSTFMKERFNYSVLVSVYLFYLVSLFFWKIGEYLDIIDYYNLNSILFFSIINFLVAFILLTHLFTGVNGFIELSFGNQAGNFIPAKVSVLNSNGRRIKEDTVIEMLVSKSDRHINILGSSFYSGTIENSKLRIAFQNNKTAIL